MKLLSLSHANRFVLFPLYLLVLAPMTLLGGACGGGGGGSSSLLPPPAPPRLDVAIGSAGEIIVPVDAGETLSVEPLPLPRNTEFDSGVFRITPDLAQAGETYSVTFVRRKGSAESRTGTVVHVLDVAPGAATSLAGQIVASDGTTPLASVVVRVQGTTLETMTDAQGAFQLEPIDLSSVVLEVDGTELSAPYAFVAEPIALLLGHTLYPGVDNVLARPVYLPPLGQPGGVVDPTVDSTLDITTSQGDVQLTIFANSAQLQGQPFTGPIYLPEVTPEFTPAALPEELDSGFVIAIQPPGISFNPPASITFPNFDQLPPGSETDIWSIDPVEGAFRIAGTGVVTADGASIVTSTGGVSQSSWHFPLPPAPSGDGMRGSDNHDDGDDQVDCVGSIVSLSSGVLMEDHLLPSYWLAGHQRSLRLSYNSGTAAPRCYIEGGVTIPARSAVPDSFHSRLRLGGSVVADYYTDTFGLDESQDESFQQVFDVDASAMPTGAFPYELELINQFATSEVMAKVLGSTVIVNRSQAPMGAGWGLSELQVLHRMPDGDLLAVDGTGASVVFSLPVQPGPGLTMQMYARVSNSDLMAGFVGNTPGLFSKTTSSGTAFDTAFAIPVVNFPDTSLDGGEHMFSTGADGIQSSFSTNDIQGDDFLLSSPEARDSFGAKLTGYLYLPSQGDVDFTIGVDDGFDLKIAGASVLSFFGTTDFRSFQVTVNDLGPGFVPIELNYIDVYGEADLQLQASGAGLPGGIIPQSNLYTALPGSVSASSFVPPQGEETALDQLDDTTFLRTYQDGSELTFTQSTGSTDLFLLSDRKDPDGNSWSYGYSSRDELVSITDPLGRVTTFNYSGEYLTSIVDSFGRTTTLDHDSTGNLTRITDCDGSVRSFGYDSNHRLISQTSKRGFRATYTYDANGRLQRSDRFDGSSRKVQSIQSAKLDVVRAAGGTQADPAPLLRDGMVMASRIDGMGSQETYSLDGFGRACASVDAMGRTSRFDRDAEGYPTSVTGPDGAVVETDYDRAGRVVAIRDLGDSSQSNDDRLWTFTYADEFHSWLQSATDPQSNQCVTGFLEIARDPQGRVLSTSDADCVIRRFEYDDATAGHPLLQGLLTKVVDADALAEASKWCFFWDDRSGNVETIVAPDGTTTVLSRDSIGRVSSVQQAGDRADYVYDDMNRVVQIVGLAGETTTLVYDEAGNLIEVTDPRTQGLAGKTRFEYEPMNRLSKRTDPNGNTETYRYDGNGRMIERVDRLGHIETWTFDVVGRMLSREFPSNPGAPGNSSVIWNWDANGNGDLTDDDTYPGSIQFGDMVTCYEWSPFGELEAVVTDGGGIGLDSRVEYDWNLGSRISAIRTYLNGNIASNLSYGYDSTQRLDRLTDSATGVSAAFSYDGSSRLTKADLFFGGATLSRQAAFNSAGKPLSRTNSFSNSQGSSSLSDFIYSYGPGGLLSSIQESRSSFTVSTRLIAITRDTRQRLSGASIDGVDVESYAYDQNGNRSMDLIQRTVLTYDPSNRLVDDGVYLYVHDEAGDLVSKTRKDDPSDEYKYTWSADEQLQSVRLPSGALAVYAYDAFGRRVQVSYTDTLGAVTTTKYAYERDRIVARLTTQPDGSTSTDVFVHGSRVDEPLFLLRDGSPYAYGVDSVGSVTELVDPSGNIQAAYRYSAFGQGTETTGSLVQPFGYAGREQDLETGLVYCRRRYLDPALGRFISWDPLGFGGGGLNTYAYGHNAPFTFRDPFGLKPAACPETPVECSQDPNFVQANLADEFVFHCNYRCYKQLHDLPGGPKSGEEAAECCYDNGGLQTTGACRGTNNFYPDNDYRHITEDPGGIYYSGSEAFVGSMYHHGQSVVDSISEVIQSVGDGFSMTVDSFSN